MQKSPPGDVPGWDTACLRKEGPKKYQQILHDVTESFKRKFPRLPI